jgi:serine/threonine protein kinase
LFARRERPGWTTWGFDTGYKLTAGGVAVHRDVKPENILIPASARAEALEV